MKAFIIITTILVATASAYFLPENPRDEYITYGQWAEPHIEYINNKKTTWTAGHNQYFKNRSLKTVKNNLGAELGKKSIYPRSTIEIPDSFADSFDPRDKWTQCDSLHDIRNQANCGCCWAFAASEAFSDRICISSGQVKQTRISADDTCFCSSGMGCQGGSNDAAWGYFQNTGAVTGFDYSSSKTKYCSNYGIQSCCLPQEPCTAELPTCPNVEGHPSLQCPYQCDAGYDKSWSADKHYAENPQYIQGESQMKAELQANGPIECGMTVYNDFPTYRTGVYQHESGQALGGHCVKVMGWGEENGTPYWLVANSWTQYWGDKGFFKILRGSDESGIEDGCMAGTPQQ